MNINLMTTSIYTARPSSRVLPLHNLSSFSQLTMILRVFFGSTALRSGSFRWPSKRPWQKDWKTKCWVGSTILPCNPCFRLKNPNYLKYPTKRFDRDFNAKTFTFLGHTCITHFLFCTKLDTTTRIIWVDLLSFIEFYGIKTRPVVWTLPIRGWRDWSDICVS